MDIHNPYLPIRDRLAHVLEAVAGDPDVLTQTWTLPLRSTDEVQIGHGPEPAEWLVFARRFVPKFDVELVVTDTPSPTLVVTIRRQGIAAAGAARRLAQLAEPTPQAADRMAALGIQRGTALPERDGAGRRLVRRIAGRRRRTQRDVGRDVGASAGTGLLRRLVAKLGFRIGKDDDR